MPRFFNITSKLSLKQRVRNPRAFPFMLSAGLALVIVLVVREGMGDIGAALMMVGWNLIWVAAFRFLPMVIDSVGWKYLFADRQPLHLTHFIVYRWVAESCNTLLPAAQMGGHVVRALMLSRRLSDSSLAGSSVLVDFTLGLVTQSLFVLSGVVLLLFQRKAGLNLVLMTMMGSAGLLMLGSFVLVRYGAPVKIADRMVSYLWKNRPSHQWIGGLKKLEIQTTQMFSNYRRLMISALFRLSGWVVKSGEIYLALFFLGASPTVANALILEAVGVAANSLGFLVPGALGIREGGILAVGTLLGLPAETVLAMALIKRVRELMVGLPGLSVLFIYERDLLFSPLTGPENTSENVEGEV